MNRGAFFSPSGYRPAGLEFGIVGMGSNYQYALRGFFHPQATSTLDVFSGYRLLRSGALSQRFCSLGDGMIAGDY